jgi:hypothetical protein
MMRVHVEMGDDMIIPVNMYAINLAPSGSGKGHSTAIMEEEVIGGFRQRFLESTFKNVADIKLTKLAHKRAVRDGTDPDLEKEKVNMEFEEQGALLFSFDSGTSAAIKQMRTKLLMAGSGSMNLEMDEIGSNLCSNTDVLNTYLELWDTGRIKQKLVKNTRDNIRSEDLFGSTPTNMLLYGTPIKLLDGSRTEDEFMDFLEVGFARRSFFGMSRHRFTNSNQTAQDMYDLYHDASISTYLMQLNDKFSLLADQASFNQVIKMQHDVLLQLYAYRIWCQKKADRLSEYEDVRKAEISHRYFKVAKLAAVYAYIDKAIYIGQNHLENAIAMAEQSGEALGKILNRDRPYVKLAHYITSINKELTQADLTDDLPFYKGTEQAKREMLNLAIAHGYKQGMYIKSELVDGIQFLSGKRVEPTDLSKVTVAYSTQISEGYRNDVIPFNRLHQMCDRMGYNWVNHHLKDGYRISIDTAKLLLKDYTWFMYTTKRHTDDEHRFRIVIPLSHKVEFNEIEYKEFMRNIFDWLPFEVDTSTGQRSRKWLTFKGKYWYNKGQFLDTLQFVSKTKKADEHRKVVASQSNLSNLERWFINNTADGNRNNQLRNYAFMLVDMGYDADTIRVKVMDLNSKTEDPLDDAEILSTIIVSVGKRVHTKGEES